LGVRLGRKGALGSLYIAALVGQLVDMDGGRQGRAEWGKKGAVAVGEIYRRAVPVCARVNRIHERRPSFFLICCDMASE
jgi:hypothetical protein